jgi:hypothetical protein
MVGGMVMDYFKVLTWVSLGGAEENHGKFQAKI